MLPSEQPDRIHVAFDDHRLVANAGLLLAVTLAQHLVSRVNYICRLASISFAGSPPRRGPVAGQRWSGSWGRQTPG